MNTGFEEKVKAILESSDYNNLPYEERTRIRKYTAEQQILDLYQIERKFNDLVTPAWKKKVHAWLANCVETYMREYGEERTES